jgi:uncharacterized protein (TIGR03382 family)
VNNVTSNSNSTSSSSSSASARAAAAAAAAANSSSSGNVVPEPAAFVLAAMGLPVLWVLWRRRRSMARPVMG